MSSHYLSPPTSSGKVVNEDDDGSFYTAPDCLVKTPMKQNTRKVIPSSSPRYTPIDFDEYGKTEVDETPTKRRCAVADDEDDINLIRRSRKKKRPNIVDNSQWWEEEPPLEKKWVEEEEDVEIVLNTETEYDDDVEIIRDSFSKPEDPSSSGRLIKRPRTGGILALLND